MMAQEQQNSLQPTNFTILTTENNSNVEFELNVITMMTSRELTLAQFQNINIIIIIAQERHNRIKKILGDLTFCLLFSQ